MTALAMSGLLGRRLVVMEAAWAPGLSVALGRAADGAGELVALAAGVERPRRGAVTLDGRSVHATATARRAIGSVLSTERFDGLGPLVRDVIGHVTAVRGSPADAATVLEPLGLMHLAEQRVDRLGGSDRRALALALALSHAEARLLAVHEPFGTSIADRARVRDGLLGAAARGAIVLVATASVHDAAELSFEATSLEAGRLTRRVRVGAGLDVGSRVELVVRSSDARRLAAVLATHAAVSASRFDEEHSPAEVSFEGSDPEALSLAVLEAAHRDGIVVEALRLGRQGLESLHAESAGLQRAAYEAAYRSPGRARSQTTRGPA